MKNPAKRPYLEKLKAEILNGDLLSGKNNKPHEDNATCEFIVANLANEHRLIFGSLSDIERGILVNRVSLAEKYNCQKNSILSQSNKAYDKKDQQMED